MDGRNFTVLSPLPDSKEWCRFFKDAGLPYGISEEYAINFARNRIKTNYLKELNGQYLKLMGIEAVGDIIAILSHAKNVVGQMSCEAVPEEKCVTVKKSEDKGKVKNKSCGPTVSNARIVNHSSSSSSDSSSSEDNEETLDEIPVSVHEQVPQRKSVAVKRKLTPKEESIGSEVHVVVPSTSGTVSAPARVLKKVRRVVPPETSEKPFQNQPSTSLTSRKSEAAVKKKSVLSRLGEKPPSISSPPSPPAGEQEPAFVVTDNFGFVKKSKNKKSNETVFARLGRKAVSTNSPDSSVVDDFDDSFVMNEDIYVNKDEDNDDDEDDNGGINECEEGEEVFVGKKIVRRNNFTDKSRFRSKQALSSPPVPKTALPYMGILKTSKQKAPVLKQTKILGTTMRADEEQQQLLLNKVVSKKIKPAIKKQIARPANRASVVQPTTEGILSGNSARVIRNNVKERLGGSNIRLKLKPNVVTLNTKQNQSISLNTKQRQNISLHTKQSLEPTQDESIGSTTNNRKVRKPIVYDLKDDDDDNTTTFRPGAVYTSSRTTLDTAATSSLSVKKVTFGEPVINYFPPNKKILYSNQSKNIHTSTMPRGSITLRTGVFSRLELGNS